MPFLVLRRFQRFLAFVVFLAVTLYTYGFGLGKEQRPLRLLHVQVSNAAENDTTTSPSWNELLLVEQQSTLEALRHGSIYDDPPASSTIYDHALKHGNREFESTYKGIPGEVAGRDGLPQRNRHIPDPEGWRTMPMCVCISALKSCGCLLCLERTGTTPTMASERKSNKPALPRPVFTCRTRNMIATNGKVSGKVHFIRV
jgi:hypothetical protein